MLEIVYFDYFVQGGVEGCCYFYQLSGKGFYYCFVVIVGDYLLDCLIYFVVVWVLVVLYMKVGEWFKFVFVGEQCGDGGGYVGQSGLLMFYVDCFWVVNDVGKLIRFDQFLRKLVIFGVWVKKIVCLNN